MFEPYEKIYNDCMNKNLTIPKYIPVREYLYRIVDYYTKQGIFNYSFGLPKTIPASFTMELIKTFDLLIEKNKYNDLDDVITFIMETGHFWNHLCPYLKAIQLKTDIDDKKSYYSTINDLVYSLKTVEENRLDTNIRIEQIIKVFAKHYQANTDSNHETKFGLTGPIVCANFYLTNLDVSLLDNLFSNIYLNGPKEYFKKYEEQFGIFYKPVIYNSNEEIEKILLDDINEFKINKKLIK